MQTEINFNQVTVDEFLMNIISLIVWVNILIK